jgi:hypothetical protein
LTEKEGIVIAEFEDTLNALLSNPEALGQIMSLAKSLSGEQSSNASPPPSQPENESGETPWNDASIDDLLSGLKGGLDPSIITMITKLAQEYGSNQNDKNLALLNALRPFLKEKRQEKIDQAIQLAKFSRIVRVAFRTMKGGEDSV